MKTSHLVILLGAGATRGVLAKREPPPPVDQDFFDIASQMSRHGTKRLASRVAKDVFNLYGRVSGIGLEQYFREIETRGEIGQIAKSQNKPKDWIKRQKDLEELIRRVLIETTVSLSEEERAIYRRILKRIRPKDTIITFNYDTVVEEVIPEDGPHWDPTDGYGLNLSGVTLAWAKNWRSMRNKARVGSNASDFHLLKLHGSLNWVLYKTKKVRLKPRPYVIRARGGVAVFDKCAILPPAWHKRINVSPYR